MKKLLVIYYTQTGQLKQIVDSTLSPFKGNNKYEIDYLQIKPVKDFPFPWGDEFFNYFPECVKSIPTPLQPFEIDIHKNYDLIILAYQPWFLSPSIPITSFLASKEAAKLLDGKNIITLIGSRNMWVGAQELIKRSIEKLNGNLVGNIALRDRTDNVIAAYTVIQWLVHGKQKASRFLPASGVSKKDISNASLFGEIIKKALDINDIKNLHKTLLKNNAVKLKFHLLNMELNGRKIFCKFADLALKDGKDNSQRVRAIKAFKGYLIFALFIISPFVSLIFMVLRLVLFPYANRRLNYYRGIELEK